MSEEKISSKLEQWKLYANTTLNVSDRRIKNNRFYFRLLIALSGATVAAAKLEYIDAVGILFGGFIGFSFSVLWFFHILSYKQLNSGKYGVMEFLAEELPYSPFEKEWEELDKGDNWEEYIPHTTIEAWWPRVLALPFMIMITYGILELASLSELVMNFILLDIFLWALYAVLVISGNPPLGRWLNE